MEITKEIILFEGKIYTRYPTSEDIRESHYFRGSGTYFHVALWESHNNCKVPKGYVIHHKNYIALDNRIENLELLTRAEHTRVHKEEEWKKNKSWQFDCQHCGKHFVSRSSKKQVPRYCSQKCRKAVYRKTFNCKNCGKEHTTRGDASGMFCSRTCANKFRSKVSL